MESFEEEYIAKQEHLIALQKIVIGMYEYELYSMPDMEEKYRHKIKDEIYKSRQLMRVIQIQIDNLKGNI